VKTARNQINSDIAPANVHPVCPVRTLKRVGLKTSGRRGWRSKSVKKNDPAKHLHEKLVILAVREIRKPPEGSLETVDWPLIMWVEESPTKGFLGWLKRKMGFHRKTFRPKEA
jgi:hypothetical protein